MIRNHYKSIMKLTPSFPYSSTIRPHEMAVGPGLPLLGRGDLEGRHVLEHLVARQFVVLQEDVAGCQALVLRLDLDAQDDLLAGAEAVDPGENQQRQRLMV